MQKLLSESNLSLLPSAIETFTFNGNRVYIKRDDLIDPLLSGNKYRKLYTLTKLPSSAIDRLISYGGNQSNAMFSISALCYRKGWKFDYYTKKLPLYLKENLSGNLHNALHLGMNMIEVPHIDYAEKIESLLKKEFENRTILLKQGGADPLAEAGVLKLAEEILEWSVEKDIEKLNIITPSGTGTTAFYLAKSLPNFKVYTVPLIGDSDYLKKQIFQLGTIPENFYIMETDKLYRFGHLYREHLEIYREFKHDGILFDLLYAPKTWLALSQNSEDIDGEILYVHSGGTGGNETMLERYAHKKYIL